jgi:vesicular inhibitory amino acid transporter
MSRSTRNPANWDEYQYGTSQRGSVSSAGGRSVQFLDEIRSSRDSSTSAHREERNGDGQDGGNDHDLRRRRSSVAIRLNALAQVGGVNSIANFARSWQRAATFHEVAPHRPSFLLTSDDDAQEDEFTDEYPRTDIEHALTERTSLLRQHLEAASVDERAVEDTETEDGELDPTTPKALDENQANKYRLGSDPTTPRPLEQGEADKYRLGSDVGSGRGSQGIFATAPHLIAELAGSYGTSYGTLRSTRRASSMVHAAQVFRDEQEDTILPDGEREPLIVKEVEQDGKIVFLDNRLCHKQSLMPRMCLLVLACSVCH